MISNVELLIDVMFATTSRPSLFVLFARFVLMMDVILDAGTLSFEERHYSITHWRSGYRQEHAHIEDNDGLR